MTAKKPTIWLLDDSGLSRESWWIQLGIPSTLNFPDYFALTRKNRTEREEEQRKIMLNEMVKTIHSYREHKFLSPKILPDAMYADLKEIYAGIPQEVFSTMPPVFAISDQFIMITEPLLHIFRHFYLGSTQISPVRLYERTTNELLSEQTYYLLNVCETHSYLSPEKNPDLRLISRGSYSVYHHPDDEAELNRFHFHPKALKCPADIWHDPLINHSIFFSQSLKEAIDKAGLYKDFSLFPCNFILDRA